MLITTRKLICDGCGKEIKEYSCMKEVIEVSDDGFAQTRGYDFCMECTLSFNEWIESRKKVNNEPNQTV